MSSMTVTLSTSLLLVLVTLVGREGQATAVFLKLAMASWCAESDCSKPRSVNGSDGGGLHSQTSQLNSTQEMCCDWGFLETSLWPDFFFYKRPAQSLMKKLTRQEMSSSAKLYSGCSKTIKSQMKTNLYQHNLKKIKSKSFQYQQALECVLTVFMHLYGMPVFLIADCFKANHKIVLVLEEMLHLCFTHCHHIMNTSKEIKDWGEAKAKSCHSRNDMGEQLTCGQWSHCPVSSPLEISKTFSSNCFSTCGNWILFYFSMNQNSNYDNQTLKMSQKKSFLTTYSKKRKNTGMKKSECDKTPHTNSFKKINQVLMQGMSLHLNLLPFIRSPFYLMKMIAWLKQNEVKILYASFKIKHSVTTPFYLELSATFIMSIPLMKSGHGSCQEPRFKLKVKNYHLMPCHPNTTAMQFLPMKKKKKKKVHACAGTWIWPSFLFHLKHSFPFQREFKDAPRLINLKPIDVCAQMSSDTQIKTMWNKKEVCKKEFENSHHFKSPWCHPVILVENKPVVEFAFSVCGWEQVWKPGQSASKSCKEDIDWKFLKLLTGLLTINYYSLGSNNITVTLTVDTAQLYKTHTHTHTHVSFLLTCHFMNMKTNKETLANEEKFMGSLFLYS
uniref:NADH dehydrogenase subunit 5 n=1 Tax=Acheilognathus imberbis TaxID=154350 RepID=A0A0U1ZBA9_9TELE|nr:NADH dehydrogenase subunit 5 [Acheilognathus imberbis]